MPKTVYMLQAGTARWLPTGYGHGLQIKWQVPVTGLVVGADCLGLKNVTLRSSGPISIALDFPSQIDGRTVSVVRADRTAPRELRVTVLLLRAVLAKTMKNDLLRASSLGDSPIYQKAARAALEALEMLFDAVTRNSAFASPIVEAGLPIGLAQVYWARRPIPLAASIPMTTRFSSASVAASDLVTFRAAAQHGGVLAVAWRFFRRARRMVDQEENYKHSVVDAVMALEVGFKLALTARVPNPLEKDKIWHANLQTLMHGHSKSKLDWSTQLLQKTYSQAKPAACKQLDTLRTERNAIVHDGREPAETWLQLRQQVTAVRDALLWLESRP
jgi:hypothetical protein